MRAEMFLLEIFRTSVEDAATEDEFPSLDGLELTFCVAGFFADFEPFLPLEVRSIPTTEAAGPGNCNGSVDMATFSMLVASDT
mmetsp:Transcript_5035/g.8685  ORF Transcript_5035/g.8685 Transcript_5035/m.8685 type:complete len:83 (-) Transcript_5035:378-626(-)